MADDDLTTNNPGRVRAVRPGDDPPISTLVQAFEGQDVSAADSIVLRGYLGRSDIIERALEYLKRAKRIAETTIREAAVAGLTRGLERGQAQWVTAKTILDDELKAEGVADVKDDARAAGMLDAEADRLIAFLDGAPAATADEIATWLTDNLGWAEVKGRELSERLVRERDARAAVMDIAKIENLIQGLKGVRGPAHPHIPWRLYLTPRLDRYVDFHRSSLIAWRQEPKTERRDACTVWLRVFEKGAQVPIPYRLVQETTLVPSFATWINGQFVDDYADESASGGAWADQSISGSNKTGPHCANRTGPRCMW